MPFFPQKVLGYHSFKTYARFFKKLAFLTPLIRTRTWVYQGARNVRFLENFAFVLKLNEWSLAIFHCCKGALGSCQTSMMKLFAKIGNSVTFNWVLTYTSLLPLHRQNIYIFFWKDTMCFHFSSHKAVNKGPVPQWWLIYKQLSVNFLDIINIIMVTSHFVDCFNPILIHRHIHIHRQ